MDGWLWWFGGVLLLLIAEMLSLQLVCLMLAGGALAAGVASALGAPLEVQFILAAVVSIALLAALRPWLLRHLRRRVPLTETNAAALVSRPAVVLSATSARGGRVKLGGEVWSARAGQEGAVYPAGTEVRVVRIDGATAVVEEPSSSPSRPTVS